MTRIERLALIKANKYKAVWGTFLGVFALQISRSSNHRVIWLLLAAMDFLIAASWLHQVVKLTENPHDSPIEDRKD